MKTVYRVNGKRRYTFVIEYDDDSDIPRVGDGMKALGGNVVAVQFSDALLELESYYDDEVKP